MDEIIKGLEEFYVKGKGEGRNVLKAIEFLYRIKENKCKFYKYLETLEMNAIKQQEEVNEPFNSLDEQNAWYYTDGYLDALKTIKDYVKGDRK